MAFNKRSCFGKLTNDNERTLRGCGTCWEFDRCERTTKANNAPKTNKEKVNERVK